jgi:hypothetical protein
MRIQIRNAEKPKPKFVLNIKRNEPGPPFSLWSQQFQARVAEALEAHQKAARVETPQGESKLSRAAFMRAVLKLSPNATVGRVKELERKLQGGDPSLGEARAALQRIAKKLKEGNIRTPPRPENWQKTDDWLLGTNRTRPADVRKELSDIGHNSVELFALALSRADDGFFGAASGEQQDIDSDVATAKARRDELCSGLLRAAQIEDAIDFGDYSQGRNSHAVFRGTNVPVSPPETAGRRLIEYIASQQRLVEFLRSKK